MTVFAGDVINASDLNEIYNVTFAKGVTKLSQQAVQSLSDNTTTALTFGAGSEDMDTLNFHDETTNNTRITPNVAGRYRLTATVALASDTTLTTFQIAIGKNGTSQSPQFRQPWAGASATGVRSLYTETILSANGTTDYFESLVLRDNTANTAINTAIGAATTSIFTCEWISA